MSDNFRWSELEDDDFVVPIVGAIAVYQNEKLDIVLRQQGDVYMEKDSVIIIPNNTIPKLLEKLNNLYLEVKDGKK